MDAGGGNPNPERANPGLAVDAGGNPVIDPTRNVLDLVQAAVLRQDDLRQSEKEHLRELLALRSEQGNNDRRHIKELLELGASYEEQLRAAEAKRIDAIRAVDVAAAAQGRIEAEARASALATQVQASAEAMRNQVASAAQAAAGSLVNALDPIQKAIDELRQAQYQAQGQKAQIVETRAGGGAVAGYIAGAVGVLVAVITIVVLLVSNSGAPA